jgi:hypothetical protein
MKAFLVYILSSQKTLKKFWIERLMWHLCFLTQGRTTCLETPHKILARSKGRIKNYDCCHEIGQLCNWRQNPNLIVFLLPGSYHEGYHPLSLQRLMWHLCFLTQGRTTCQEIPHKILARSKGRIENYDCCRETGQLCIWRQNPNLIIFLLPGSYHEGYHPFSLQTKLGSL